MAAKKEVDSLTASQAIWLTRAENVWLLALHIQPGARRTGVVGVHGDRLKIAIAAPAQDGRANEVLLRFLATQLRIPRTALELISGASSRAKRVSVSLDLGGKAADVKARLTGARE